MTRAAFLICLIAGAVCLIYSNVLGIIGGILILLAFYVRIGEIETEQHLRGFSVAMEKFPGMVLETIKRLNAEARERQKDCTVIQDGERIYRIGRDC